MLDIDKKKVNELLIINNQIGQPWYVMEECSELIKAIVKGKRYPERISHVVEEALDVMTTVYTMLNAFEKTDDEISTEINNRLSRALDRYHKNGEI